MYFPKVWLLTICGAVFINSVSSMIAGLCVSESVYGTTKSGAVVQRFVLEDSDGLKVCLMSLGATITEIQAPDRDGVLENVILGKDNWETYRNGFGGSASVIGRFANRIQGAAFEVDGERFELSQNNGKNHIHGGRTGFASANWSGSISHVDHHEVSVTFSHFSPDGDQGYPGALTARVIYTLTTNGELRISYEAETTKPTHINLTNHAYFNLAGKGHVLNQLLQIDAQFYTPTDKELIPTGEILSVEGSALDFRKWRSIGSTMDQLPKNYSGYDHNFVLGLRRNQAIRFADAYDDQSGRALEVWTTEPGVQLYTGNHLGHRGFCLETQSFPDSPNQKHFPSSLLRPGSVFKSETTYRFYVRAESPIYKD